jgi:hypothetical protein
MGEGSLPSILCPRILELIFPVASLVEPAVDRIECIRAQVYERNPCWQAEEWSSQIIATLRDYSEASP